MGGMVSRYIYICKSVSLTSVDEISGNSPQVGELSEKDTVGETVADLVLGASLVFCNIMHAHLLD